MNAPWSGLGVPAISVPMPRAGRLPLGLQLVAGWHQDAFLLDVARRVELSLYQRGAASPSTRLLQ
jgi:aspartyl-tRNA(Asn)/glutamyl-tRNA(Gln) amidotransferase subunit A